MRLDALLFDDELAGDDLDAALLHFGPRSWTRGDLQHQAEALRSELVRIGVGTGHAVAVMLDNGPEPVAALFGVWRTGAVHVPLNPRLPGAEVTHILDSVDPVAVVTTAGHAVRLSDQFAGRPIVITAVDEWSTAAEVDHPEARQHDPDVALIQFTSGTTGRPKPVLLLHSGVLTLLDGVLAKLRSGTTPSSAKPGPPRSPMPNLIPVSLSLWAGIYNVLFAFRVGAPVVIMDGFDPAEFRALVARFEIRSTVLPPAAMTMLTDDPAITDLAPLRFVRSITAPLSPLQARRFKDRFAVAVLNSYGQTEIGGEIVGWNAADSRQHGEDKLGSVGRPHAGVTVRVVDDDDHDVPVSEPGELWVQTPALSAGYADGGDLSDRMSEDGWFRTGDYARVDEDGFVWIEGRVSSMINRGGLKVYPGEVEEVIRLHPSVADVAVVGGPDDRLGEVPWAFVVARQAAPAAAELTELCRAHLAPYKVPVRFEVIDDLPRNEVGKVLARELIERFGASS